MALMNNAITKGLAKVDAEVARIVQKLDDVDNAWTPERGYKHDAYTRQGARALAVQMRQVSSEYSTLADTDPHDSSIPYAASVLETVATVWNKREDWRAGAFAANVAKAVERLVGLS